MVWLEVVGWVGSALLVWSLLQTRILRLRALNLVGSAVLIVYNAVAGVWPMLGLNTTLALINIWQLRTLIKTRHDGPRTRWSRSSRTASLCSASSSATGRTFGGSTQTLRWTVLPAAGRRSWCCAR